MSDGRRTAAQGALADRADARRDHAGGCCARAWVVLLALCLTAVPLARAAGGGETQAQRWLTVEERVAQLAPGVRARLEPHLRRAGLAYPPAVAVLVGIKSQRELELYAGPSHEALRHIRTYPVQGLSGTIGPKLHEGDLQVPEGVYPVTALNPNSSFHVSLKIGYPNRFDRRVAAYDGRRELGGDIFIHGSDRSIGCLAMGDPVAEELFVLAAEIGVENMSVILTPVDLRRARRPKPPPDTRTVWTSWRYDAIERALRRIPSPCASASGERATKLCAAKHDPRAPGAHAASGQGTVAPEY